MPFTKGHKINQGKHWKPNPKRVLVAINNLPKNVKGSKNGFFGKHHSKETLEKMSKYRKGKNYRIGKLHSEETKEKMRVAHIGIAPWNKGKKFPERQGEKNPKWKGGYKNKLLHNKKRIIKKAINGGSHTSQEWENLKAQYNLTCPCCHKKEPDIKLTKDHIISISKGGSDNIENIQPLCKKCNSEKHNKEIKYGT